MNESRYRVVAVVEARMGSSRLPGKTLMDVEGKTLLERVLDRLKLANTLDNVVVATSVDKSDDGIVELCESREIDCFRGSLNDVLDRVYRAACEFSADIVVQCGADNPFYDPDLVDLLVYTMIWGGYAYCANDMSLTFPEGIDCHVIRFDALQESAKFATQEDEREDTPRYIWNHPDKYTIYNLEALKGTYFCRPDVRLSVDYPEDMELCRKIYAFFGENTRFSTMDLLQLLDENADWLKINENCKQVSAAYVS